MHPVVSTHHTDDPLSFDYREVIPFHPDDLRRYRNLYRTNRAYIERSEHVDGLPEGEMESSDVTRALITQQNTHDPRRAWKLYRVVSGHSGIVHSIAADPHNAGIDFSTDFSYHPNAAGNLFYTASADCTIKCWDGLMGACQLTLTGHTAGVHCLATSTEFPYIFSAGEDRDIRIWDLQGGAQKHADGTIRAAKLSGAVNQTIAKLHGSLGCLYTLETHPRVPFLLISGGSDGAVRVWDIRCNRCVFSFFGHEGTVETLCAQPTEPQIISGGSDGTVRLWNLTAGKMQAGANEVSQHKALKYHSKAVRASFLHPTEYVYTSLSSDSVRFWKLPEGEHVRHFAGHQTTGGVPSGVDSLHSASLADSGEFFVTGHASGSLRFHDWKTGACYLEKHEQSVSDMEHKISADGQPPYDAISAQERGVVSMALNRRNNVLVTGLRDKTIHMYVNPEGA